MTITIPSVFLESYQEGCDLLLSSDLTSKACKVYYPPLRVECDNCLPTSFGGSVYKPGGPYQFEGICPYCNGKSYKEEETYDDIRLRFYLGDRDFTGKKFKTTPEKLDDMAGYIIGKREDLVKISRGNYIALPLTEVNTGKFRLASEPAPWGLGTKYFTANISLIT